jgi:hypothetical protein
VAAQALLLELVVTAHLSGENGFTFGLLYARELTRADNARRAYRPALRKASTTRTRRWAR